MPHDLVIVGGGLAGSCLALVMARQGASVLVLEREERFRDRIRGEGIHVWGTVEARAVGVFDQLRERCAHELDDYKTYEDGVEVSSRDFVATTPARGKELTFYHPEMQETLLECARSAGADVWRGARVVEVRPGDPPRMTVQSDGVERQMTARLMVGADGRRSAVRTWSGFGVKRDPDDLRITGVLISGIPAQETTFHCFSRPGAAWNTQFIPLGRQRYRAYFVSGDRRRHPPIGGASGSTHFLAYARDSGVPTLWLESMRLDGPMVRWPVSKARRGGSTIPIAKAWLSSAMRRQPAIPSSATGSRSRCATCGS